MTKRQEVLLFALWLSTLAGLSHGAVMAGPGQPETVYPQLALGGGYECVVIITNRSDSPWVGTAHLIEGNEQAWSSAWGVNGVDSTGSNTFDVELASRATRRFVLSGDPVARAGYLRVVEAETPSAGSNGGSSSAPALSFFYNFYAAAGHGGLEDSTGVPSAVAGDSFAFPVEKTGSVNTGFAWASAVTSPLSPPFPVDVYLFDASGVELQHKLLNFEGHRDTFFSSVFDEIPDGFLGKVVLESQGQFHLTVIRLEMTGQGFQLTSVPPEGLAPEEGTSSQRTYPQLALGGGYDVVLILSNKTTEVWSGAVRLRQDNDQDWGASWALGGSVQQASQFEIELAAEATQKYILSGDGLPRAGYLQIVPDPGKRADSLAAAFFYNFSGNQGLIDSTGVPYGDKGKYFVSPVEKTAIVDTGFAWAPAPQVLPMTAANPRIEATLYGEDGQQVQQKILDFQGHEALFFTGIFDNVEDGFVGQVTLESDDEFYLTVIRLQLTEGGFQLTSVPPAAEANRPLPKLAWKRLGGPPGGLGYDIRYSFDDPDIWYVTEAFSGVHVSEDNGQTWKPKNTGIPGQAGRTMDSRPVFSLTIDPHDPKIIWAGTDKTGHIYRSTDGGATWVQRDQGITIKYDILSFRGFTVDPQTSNTVYAMAETQSFVPQGEWVGGVVYKTSDAGENWEIIWEGAALSSLARYLWIDPRDPDVLFVSTGIFDRGAVGEGDQATDPFGGLGVLKSVDGGQTWTELNEANGLNMLYIGSLFMHPDDPDILLAAAGHLISGPAVGYVLNLATPPNGVYRTTDGGENWTQVIVPDTDPPERALEAYSSVEICTSGTDIAYAGSDLAIYRSEDSGVTWTRVAGGASWGPPGVVAGWPIDMQCDPRDPDRVFANNYMGGNFLSEDGGKTWKNASNGYTGAGVLRVAVDPNDAGRIYVAGRTGVWLADQGGNSWYGLQYPVATVGKKTISDSGAIVVDPNRSAHLLAGDQPVARVLESDDDGLTWEVRWELDDPPPLGLEGLTLGVIEFAPSEADTVYAAGGERDGYLLHEARTIGLGVIASVDGGTNWQRSSDALIKDLAVYDLAVDPMDAQIVYAATPQGVFKSVDGSTSWSLLTGLPSGQMVRAIAVSPADRQYLLAGVEGVGVYASTDGGVTWNPSYTGLEANGSLHDIVFDPTDSEIVYTSDYLSGVYRSADGGKTWLEINDGLSTRTATSLSISADGRHLYVGTYGEGCFRLDLDGQEPSTSAAAGQSRLLVRPEESNVKSEGQRRASAESVAPKAGPF